ncbi:MAG TPA: hypothetical protein DHV85_11005 [Candidatus Accumulibacter sp.]|nr:hypothetical protein [Accumulibacter sp.]
MAVDHSPVFQTLSGVYEPSGIQQLPDGRFIVVEDDPRQALSVLRIAADGCVDCTALIPNGPPYAADEFWQIDDLEGVTVDRAGYVYAISSHSRNSAGQENADREKLLRFRIEGDRVVEPMVATGLKHALIAAHPLFAAAAEIRDVKNEGGLNIEGLAMSPDQSRLLIGFRSPLLDRRAIIASIENPQALFEAGEEARIAATLTTLDLRGNGIRGMAWVPALAGYLVVGGPVARAQVQFDLWFWSGNDSDPARRVTVDGLSGFEHAEGVSSAMIDGRQRIVIVSDDGSRKFGRIARFLLLDLEQLQID